jgi:hypothetical protein
MSDKPSAFERAVVAAHDAYARTGFDFRADQGFPNAIRAAHPILVGAALRDVAEELDQAGLRQAGQVVLRLAAKHEKGASE